jgi:methylphosphotriester-DNA--protein-cysteine methyltransferase
LLAAQEQAHERKLGVWSAAGPKEEPRSYRARNFRDQKGSPRPLSFDNHIVIGNRRSRVAHWPGCGHIEEMASKNVLYFSSVAEAQAQGYRMEKGSR